MEGSVLIDKRQSDRDVIQRLYASRSISNDISLR